MSNVGQAFSMGAAFGFGLATLFYLAIYLNMKWNKRIKEWNIKKPLKKRI